MKRLLFLGIACCLAAVMQAQVSYYSVINSQALISGTSDCWLINYSVWHNNNTVHVGTDDVNLGSRNTVVGTDCPQRPIDGDSEIEHTAASLEGIELLVFPNPVSDEITVSFSSAVDARNWKWQITSLIDASAIKGHFDGSGDLIIPVFSLPNGKYLFSMTSDMGFTYNSEFSIQH